MRSIRLMMSFVVVLISLVAIGTSEIRAQEAASPIAIEGANDLNLPGIESKVMGTGTSTSELSGIPRMRLERVTLPVGASLPPHIAGGPELLVAEIGTPGITDSFGFTGQIAPEGGTFFEGGAEYTLSNPGTEIAVVLRLSTTEGLDESTGTPTPVGGEVALLIDSPLDEPHISEATLTIARLTWHPNDDLQRLDHPSALGLIVVEGTLFAKSPSGFDGQLAANTPVVFPASTPLAAHAGGDGPATALIVSILDDAEPILTAPKPTPTPLPTTTPTLEPSITPTPTQTLVPTEIPIPTETPTLAPTITPTITPTPLPTVDPNTVAGSILQNHGTWQQGNGRLTVDIGLNDNFLYGAEQWYGSGEAVVVSFFYSNLGTTRQDFVVSPLLLFVSDDNGNSVEAELLQDQSATQRVILEPGADFEYFLIFPNPNTDGNFFLSVSEFGDVRDAQWGFTISQGKIVPMADDVARGGQSATNGQINMAPAGDQTDQAPTHVEIASLPSSIDGLVISGQGTRSQYEITSTFPNPSEADTLFTQWGWSGSSFAMFVSPAGASGPNGVYEIDIGIHQLAAVIEAEQALQYFMASRADLLGLWQTEVERFGSMTRALIGPSGDGGYEASVYVAIGSKVVRVTAVAWYDYPLADAVAIMRQVVGT